MVDKFETQKQQTVVSKPRIMLVDDSRFIRASAVKMFNGEFDLVLAEDGQQAWNMIQQDKSIQVIFTDLVMPKLDGYELLECVRTSQDEEIRNLPVILLTGADNSREAEEKALSMGATDFICKPFKANDIKMRARSLANYQRATQVLKEQTTLDSLTGLHNKRGLALQLEGDISLVTRHQEDMAVMVVELDSFKDLFVRIGRSGAEAIVKKVAKVLQKSLRKEDTVARTGLSCFVLSLPMAKSESANELAIRICQTVEAFKVILNSKSIRITVSVGLCVMRPNRKTVADVDTLLDAAYESHQKAVALGRGQIYELSIEEYIRQKEKEKAQAISIDLLLEQIQQGEVEEVATHLDAVLNKLGPLLILLSNEQKQRLITYR